MAYESFANDAHNNRAVSLAEHEQIVTPLGLSGFLGYTSATAAAPPVFADGTGMQVKIRAGAAGSIRGTRFNNTSETTVAIGSNSSGNTRIDLVVLRLRRTESESEANDQYTISPYVIQGTPAAENPTAPALVRDDTPGEGFFDIPAGEATVVNGAATITAAQWRPRAYYVTGSGYTGRDEWGRPPIEPGVLFRADDTGVTYIGTAAGTWVVLGEDTGWSNGTTGAGWSLTAPGSSTPSGYLRVRRVNRAVFLAADVFRTGGSLAQGAVTVGTLPVGYAPDVPVLASGTVNINGGGPCRFSVSTAGVVGVQYYAGISTGRAVSVQTSWPAGPSTI